MLCDTLRNHSVDKGVGKKFQWGATEKQDRKNSTIKSSSTSGFFI